MHALRRLAVAVVPSLLLATAGRAQSLPAADEVAPWEDEMARFDAMDRRTPPPTGGIVFVGSSSIRLWAGLAQDFPGVPLLNRGFGGSTLPDVVRWMPTLVLRHRPRLVVLYAGDNDLASGRTPAQVRDDYRAFASRVHGALPEARIAFVAIKPSPSRWALVDRVREANRLVRDEVARDSLATYVDVFTPMLGANGHPRPSLFLSDSLHLTPEGYALWRERLAPVVERWGRAR